ncbi:hypothetical protein PMAYCL1PPCAC_16909 [Pristionchus mayeri]|uniref:Lipase n=1 Tax=Pristionchus mayeri TaxID=1317129 RepID=A0AAN5CLN5_9BILA|nr:hypothetical protein PMAYCL1PPCAC_16909 [Pristionchus mayeri]
MRLLILPSLLSVTSAYFSTDFTRWLDNQHGVVARQLLERADLQDQGSFGGKSNANETISRNPVVFVHGVSSVAGTMMAAAAGYYKGKGYKEGELYATTYENPNWDNAKWIQYTMKCDHVSRMRLLINSVHAYTGKPVDVVAFSMGVPIARKAILGGKCVDNDINLGPSITSSMGTFVGVCGPNNGVAPMIGDVPFALCALSPLIPVCNPIDGLFSGFCPFKSRFIDDINAQKRYEGKRIYSIGSEKDEVVGHNICMEVTTRINGQDGEKIYKDRKHDDTFKTSYDAQLAMLSGQPF